MAFTHGPAIDQPLGIIRMGFNPTGQGIPAFEDAQMQSWAQASVIPLVPHTNWRGAYDGGTDMSGRQLPCETNLSDCTLVVWPGGLYRGFYNKTNQETPPTWFGGLIEKNADASSFLYMRNRYYNPETGVFTQEDPIGIAEG